MNKIVREHYPVSKLPEDLREGMDENAEVTVIVEETPKLEMLFKMEPRKPLSAAEMAESIRSYKALGRPSIDSDEAVARIRALRDEWDDE